MVEKPKKVLQSQDPENSFRDLLFRSEHCRYFILNADHSLCKAARILARGLAPEEEIFPEMARPPNIWTSEAPLN